MKKLFIIVISLCVLYSVTSCNSTSELLNNTSKAGASSDEHDLNLKTNELEERIENLEQGSDSRAAEYNVIKSALWEMLKDNEFGDGIPGVNFPCTNDMTQFPSPDAPLYGFDINHDGLPDINYVSFQRSEWFYQFDSDVPDFLFQGPDPGLVENQNDENKGTAESYEVELHNIQLGVMALLADSEIGLLDSGQVNITDMDLVTTDGESKRLSEYLTGLDPDGTVKTSCLYSFDRDGTVSQTAPDQIGNKLPGPS